MLRMNYLTLLGLVCIAILAPALSAQEAVKAWEDSIIIDTYPWYDDHNPVFEAYEGRIYYPYTRQDHIGKEKAPRTYRTLCLENEYLRVTCIPELGGRVHSVFNKTTGEEMFHTNHVVKPALIAMRGAWISGGIEWNTGPHGHTVTVVSPVDALLQEHPDGSATLVVGNTEKIFRTRWTVRLTLHPGKSYLDETIRMYNPMDGVHPYYFWNCTAFPNLPGTRFIYPMTLGTDHHGREFYSWPVHEGRDLSLLDSYPTMSSVFGYKCVFDFFGAYDENRDRGIVSYANHHVLPGKKAWTWGKDDFGVVSQSALSDADRAGVQYIEVQSGPLLTQSDYGMLRPRQEVTWREYWYPVHGLGGGFEYATRDLAVCAERENGTLLLRLLATGRFPGARCVLSAGETVLREQTLDLSPEQPVEVRLEDATEGAVDVAVYDAANGLLLAYATPLDIPHVEPPDLTRQPARPDGRKTADELYEDAFLTDSRSRAGAARASYQKVLEEDPLHVPARCALATLDIEHGAYADAKAHVLKALERGADNAHAWYLRGVAHLGLGELAEARKAGYKAAHALDALPRGYSVVGRAEMRLGNYKAAREAFRRVSSETPRDTRNRDHWLLARHAAGDAPGAAEFAAHIEKDPTDFVLRAIASLAVDGDFSAFVEALRMHCGEQEFTAQEAACVFAECGQYAGAAALLEAVLAAGMADSPMTRYYAAWYRSQAGDTNAAQDHLETAAGMSADLAFPARPEARAPLAFAAEEQPEDANAHLLMGYVAADLGSLEKAVAHWEDAVERNPDLHEAWRLLGLQAWKKDNNLEQAEACYRNAIRTAPKDQVLYRDLARILTSLKRRAEAIGLVQRMPHENVMRYDVSGWLAQALLDEGRYTECIDFLAESRFSNWEASSRPRDIFVQALLGRGKARYEAGDYEAALADFERALTYPENLEVGARYEKTNAETQYWLGKTCLALDRPEDARTAWENGAGQRTSAGPALPFIRISAAQDEHVEKCRTALEVMRARAVESE